MNIGRHTIVSAILTIAAIATIGHTVQAQTTETVKWYTDRTEALAVARSQHKNVLLLFGRDACIYCQAAKSHIKGSIIKPIVDKNFILWFSTADEWERAQEQSGRYWKPTGNVAFPFLAVINPVDSSMLGFTERSRMGIVYSNDMKMSDKIVELLNAHLPKPESFQNQPKDYTALLCKEDGRTHDYIFLLKDSLSTTPDTAIKGLQPIKWYEDRTEALDSARRQQKKVLLLYGHDGCGNCVAVKRHIQDSLLNPIIRNNFILWFSNRNVPAKRAQSIQYWKHLTPPGFTLPFLAVIDPKDSTVLAESTEYQPAKDILKMLKPYITKSDTTVPNAAERIDMAAVPAYLSGGMLTVVGSGETEQIGIYTLDGRRVDSFVKGGEPVTRSTAGYPRGVLIVVGADRWSVKVLNR